MPEEHELKGIRSEIEETEKGYKITCDCGWSKEDKALQSVRRAFGQHINRAKKHEEDVKEYEEGKKPKIDEEEGIPPAPIDARNRGVRMLSEKLPKVFGISERRASRIIETIQDNPRIIDNPTELYYHIRQYCSGKVNDYDLRNTLDAVYEEMGEFTQPRPPRFGRTEHRPTYDYTYPGGGHREELENLPSELKEIVIEERRRKDLEVTRESLGINELEERISNLTKILSKGRREERGPDERSKLVLKGLKWDIYQDLMKRGGVAKGGMGGFYDKIGDIGTQAIESLSPVVWELVKTTRDAQTAFNAMMMKQVGMDPREVLGIRRAPSWEEVQERIKIEKGEEEEEKEEVKEKPTKDIRELMG